MATSSDFLTGVIEGFYGTPWTPGERFELFAAMPGWGLNTYLYGPKDDLHHRARWRQTYPPAEAEHLREVIAGCQARGIRFIYALGPGLDIRYSEKGDRLAIQQRFEQLLSLGCRDFCLLFDDIPDQMAPADREHWGSFASAHAGVANEIFRWVRPHAPEGRFIFCPTPYCGRMASRQLGGPNYLATVGRELAPEIEVFWTGPEIISREITVPHLRELQGLLRRKPLLWDNIHANDYDGHRFFCGPYAGRPPEILREVTGILTNPNTEFALNRIPFQTLGAFVRGQGGSWDPRAAYLAAVADWLPKFATTGKPLTAEDLALLGDCYYLPFELGSGAQSLLAQVMHVVSQPPAQWGAAGVELRERVVRLKELCFRLTELVDRSLFAALNRRIWELREEMDLLERFLTHHSDPAQSGQPFQSDFHQARTYRGGLVAQLQRQLVQHADGSFTPRDPADPDSQTARLFLP
ncbi:MAG: beta-N-acetylglucosaminidase domain-containing protein [Verrucomicrobia bacterium]|nr:beta-N-acetylglucosaminidase domain-containing protein [Verrucomicrobiota bacterium]